MSSTRRALRSSRVPTPSASQYPPGSRGDFASPRPARVRIMAGGRAVGRWAARPCAPSGRPGAADAGVIDHSAACTAGQGRCAPRRRVAVGRRSVLIGACEAGEWQLDLEYLWAGVGEFVFVVYPHFTTRARDGLVAVLLDPPGQILIDHREDARCRAAAHGDGCLDFRQDTVAGGRGEFGRRLGHWHGQIYGDVLAVLAFVKDDAGAGFLDPVMYPKLVELRDQMVDNRNDVRRPESGRPPSDHDHAGGGNRLGHDVVCWHAVLLAMDRSR